MEGGSGRPSNWGGKRRGVFSEAVSPAVRGQTVIEFVLLVGAVLVFVAAILTQGFKQSEVNLAIASVRLSAANFSSFNPAFRLSYVNYSVAEDSKKVLLRPKFYNFSSGGNEGAANDSEAGAVYSLQQVFHPAGASAFTVGNCVRASYYEYCVDPCFGAESTECKA